MKNTLITEINRINELMIGKSLITEQGVENFLADLLTKVGDDGFKKFFKKGTTKTEQNILLNKLKMGGTLSDTDLKLILNKISPSTFANYIMNNKLLGTHYESRLNDYAKSLVNDPTKYGETIQQLQGVVDSPKNLLLKDAPDFIKTALKKQIKTILDDKISTLKNLQSTSSVPVPSSAPTPSTARPNVSKLGNKIDIYNKNYKDIGVLNNEEIEKIKRFANAKKINIAVRSEKLINNLLRQFSSEEVLINKLLTGIKTYIEEGKSTTPDSGTLTAISNELSQIIKSLGIKNVDNEQYLTEWMNKNIVDPGILNRLYKLPFYKRIEEISKLTNNQEEFIKKIGSFGQRRWDALKQFGEFVYPGSWFGKRLANKYPNTDWKRVAKWGDLIKGDNYKRLRNDFFTGKTLSNEELKKYRELFGLPATIGAVGADFILNFIVYTVLRAFISWVEESFAKMVYNEKYTPTNFFTKGLNRWLKYQSELWHEKFPDGEQEETNKPSEKDMATKNVETALKYLNFELSKAKFFYLPGEADDLSRAVSKIIYIISKEQLTSDDVNEINKNLDQVKNITDSLGTKLKTETDRVKNQTTTPPTGTQQTPPQQTDIDKMNDIFK